MAFHLTRQYNFKYLGLDQLIGGGWPDNCAEVSSLDWQTGAGKCSYASFFAGFSNLCSKPVLANSCSFPHKKFESNCIVVSAGAPNAKYWVVQLLARTVGSSAEKIIYTVAPSHYANVENARAVYALPYELLAADGGGGGKPSGTTKGLMLVNKRNYSVSVSIPGVVSGNATVVEATGATPGWQLPINRSFASDGSISLGPYAVAVAPAVQLDHIP